MEQRKSDINTDGNVVNIDTNGLSYSFDFSNQVGATNTMGPAAPIANPEVQPGQVGVQNNATPVAQSVEPTAEPVATSTPVEPTAAPVATAEPVVATEMPTAQPIAAPESTEQAVVHAQPTISFEQQEQSPSVSQVAETTIQADDEELIKDKKGTKLFLIILLVIVLGFIFFLPTIWQIIESYL